MLEALQLDFMQNALMAGILASITCGVMGSLVVVNRLVFLSGGVAHAAYGGVGLAFFFGFSPLLGVLGFSVAAALVMAAVTLKSMERSDAVIGVMWAAGMALGIVLVDRTPGYNVDLLSYLFGSILAVPRSDLWVMAGLCLAVVLCAGFYYRDFLALGFDRDFARLRGVRIHFLHFFLLILVAVSVVLTIRVVGLILVVALLTIGPYIAEKFVRSLWAMMVVSVALSVVFTVTGLAVSYAWDLTSGAAIILVASAAFFAVLLFQRFFSGKKASARPAG